MSFAEAGIRALKGRKRKARGRHKERSDAVRAPGCLSDDPRALKGRNPSRPVVRCSLIPPSAMPAERWGGDLEESVAPSCRLR